MPSRPSPKRSLPTGRHRPLDAHERPQRRHPRLRHRRRHHRHPHDHRRRRRPDTAVGAFTIALATNPTGIRDAAGNQSSFAATTPTDSAKPVLVAGTLAMKDIDGNGKIDHVTASFSEPLAASTDTTPWTLTNVPSAGTLAAVSTVRHHRHPDHQRRRRRRQHRRRHLQIALAASPPASATPPATKPRFAATAPADLATPVLVSLVMQDTNANGKVDRAVAIFSEALAAYTAATAPWTLANAPSGGSLASVAVATSNATLTITEGAGAPDTAVGAFTIALTTNPTGIRDAAGNQSSFAATAPTDSAKPVLVAGTLVMKDIDGNGKIDHVTADFSEPLASSTDTTPWTLTNVPSGGTLAAVSTAAATATLTISEGAGAANTAVGTFKVVLAASATGIRDAAGNQSTLASTAPADLATPVLVSLVMQDTNANGKVDRVVAVSRSRLLPTRPRPPPGRSRTLPAAAPLPPSPSPPATPPSRSQKAQAPPTPPSAPSRSHSPKTQPGSVTLPATNPPSPPPPPRQRQAGPCGRHPCDERPRRKRQSRPCHRRLQRTARLFHRHDPVDAHQRAKRRHPGCGLDGRHHRHPDNQRRSRRRQHRRWHLQSCPRGISHRDPRRRRQPIHARLHRPGRPATPVLVSLVMQDTNRTARSTVSLPFLGAACCLHGRDRPLDARERSQRRHACLRRRRRQQRHPHDHRRRRRPRHRRRRLHDRTHQKPNRDPRRCRQPILLRRHHPHDGASPVPVSVTSRNNGLTPG